MGLFICHGPKHLDVEIVAEIPAMRSCFEDNVSVNYVRPYSSEYYKSVNLCGVELNII